MVEACMHLKVARFRVRFQGLGHAPQRCNDGFGLQGLALGYPGLLVLVLRFRVVRIQA